MFTANIPMTMSGASPPQSYRRSEMIEDDDSSANQLGIMYTPRNEPRVIFRQGVQEPGPGVCLTPECVVASAAVLTSMSSMSGSSSDSDSLACTDFYEYACGGWSKRHPTPDGQSQWGNLALLWQENQMVMKEALESRPDSDLSGSDGAESKARSYYASCMDPDDIREMRRGRPLVDLITSIGGWNVSGPYDSDLWEFQRTLRIILGKYILNAFILVNVGVDERNSTRNILQVDQGGLGLPDRQYYINDTYNDVLLAYSSYLTSVGMLLSGEVGEGVDDGAGVKVSKGSRQEVSGQAQQVVDLEVELARITRPPTDNMGEDEGAAKYTTLGELHTICPAIDWLELFRAMFSDVSPEVMWDNESVVAVYNIQYLYNLTHVIDRYMSTRQGRDTLNTYMVWQLVRLSSSFLSKAYHDAILQLEKALMGVERLQSKWRFCVGDTDEVLGFALGAMFVREAFKGDMKLKVV